MNFSLFFHDKTLKDNNGGSIVLEHWAHALERLGHFVHRHDLKEDIPEGTHYVIFQSEWYNTLENKLKNTSAKSICWLGHYYPATRYCMPKPSDIKADKFITQWKGECVEQAKKELRNDIYYFPHGYCEVCNVEGKYEPNYPKKVFIGADYPERQQDWIDYAGISRVKCPWKEAKNYYKSAVISPTIHGDFQKNKKTDYMMVSGTMINDRIFNVIMSGGFAICDDVPILQEFFTPFEVPRASDKEGFKYLVDFFMYHPEERIEYMERAKKRIIENYSYTKYMRDFLQTL